jgi:hypothetical protein
MDKQPEKSNLWKFAESQFYSCLGNYSPEKVEILIDNKEVFLEAFCQQFMSRYSPNENVYSVFVDYESDIDEILRDRFYNWVNPEIKSSSFSNKIKGKANIRIRIMKFNSFLSFDQVFHVFGILDYRPVTLRELIAVGKIHLEVQPEARIIALGSYRKEKNGYLAFPSVYKGCLGNVLDVDFINYDSRSTFGNLYQFAVVYNGI